MDEMVREALEAFVAFSKREEIVPTVRDLQLEMGLSSSSLAYYRLQKMEASGLVRHRGAAANRSWVLTDKGRAALETEAEPAE